MELKLNKNVFISNFLTPLNKIADKGVLSVSKDKIECTSCSSFDKKEQTIILYSKCDIGTNLTETEKVQLNLPNIKKLINAISFIDCDTVNLTIDNNSISYINSADEINFRYHLLEDNVLEKPSVKIEKVYEMGFDFESLITQSNLQKVLKASVFSDQSNKIYLYTKNSKFHCTLTDNNIQNVDNISLLISESYTGDDIKKPIAMNLEIYRILSSMNFDSVVIKINQAKGIIMFDIKRENYLLQYIVTSLVK